MATINTGPAAVDTGATTTTIGPLDRAPGAVPPASDPGIPTAPPVYNQPVDRAPAPVEPGPGLGTNPGAAPAASIPVFEVPVEEAAPAGAGASVSAATPVYIKVLSDGTVVTENTLALNFLGNGVSVAANGSTANITITAGGSTYSNSNVVTLMSAFGSNTVSTTGNITGGYILGNGSQLTGLPATYGNANVAANLAAFGTNPISTTGNITGGNILGGANVNATTHTGATVSVTGNITGSYFIGNGSQLTGIPAGGGNNAVQINVGGVLSGAAGFSYNTAANALFVPEITASGNSTTGINALYAGAPGYVVLGSSVMAQFTGNVNDYSQINFQNINNGNLSSGDYIITANNGTDSTYYLDLGLAGNNHVDPDFFGDTSSKNDGYLYVTGADQAGPAGGVGNLILGSTNGVIKMFVGNTAQANVIATVSQSGVSVSGNVTGSNLLTGGLISVAGNITSNNLIISSGIVGSGASPAPSLSGFSTISTTGAAGNISASGNVLAAGYVSAAGNITSGNVSTGVITLTNGAVIRDTAGEAVAFGDNAGLTSQGNQSVAIGQSTGTTTQGASAVAIGSFAGQATQGIEAVAVGYSAASNAQSAGAVAIGYAAGQNVQGNAAVAIGYFAGRTGQGNNSIIINATAANLDQTTANTFTVAPVRNDAANTAQVMFYNTTSKEITYGNTISVAGNITGGNIQATIGDILNVTSTNLTVTNISAPTSGNIVNIGAGGNNNLVVSNVLVQVQNVPLSVAGNITGGNILTGVGVISTGGNVNGNVFNGNVAFGAGVIGGSGNITGGNILTSGLISATGNVTGGNLATTGLTSTASLSITGNTATVTTANYSIGYLNVPQVSLAANSTIALTDSGKHYYSVSAANLSLTIANNTSVAWPIGTAITIVNAGTASILINQGTGVSMYQAGNATGGNRVLATFGMATVMNTAANTWFINGTGLT